MSTAAKGSDNAAATAKHSSSTLSRNALYTPLVAYEQTNVVDPSTYMTTRKNVPSSLRESSLVDFIQSVSSQNTEKPLSTQHVEERIRQRALTLVGGGINSSMSTAGKRKRRQQRRHEELSNRQRKRIQAKAKQPLSSKTKHDDEKVFNLFLEVHQKWKTYVRKLAEVDDLLTSTESIVLTESSQKTISSRLAQAELVGAYIRITECRAHQAWIGKEGLIVGTTTNTWRVAIMNISPENKQKQRPKVLVVPKQGSKLVFRLSMSDGSPPLCVVVRGKSGET